MDNIKTGVLISEIRKEKGLTQKQLAKQLQISDRTVSKWERGAGFPDVSFLEPLASILEVHVLDLLRGERTAEDNVQAAVSEALAALIERRRQTRRSIVREAAKVVAFLLIAGIIMTWVFPLKRDIDQIITAGIYHNGNLIAYTDVEIKGVVEHTPITGQQLYYGRFAIDCIEWTMGEETTAEIYLNKKSGLVYMVTPGTVSSSLCDPSTVISLDMQDFAFEIRCQENEWYILASSPETYKTYYEERGGVPPLESPKLERLPDFPSSK